MNVISRATFVAVTLTAASLTLADKAPAQETTAQATTQTVSTPVITASSSVKVTTPSATKAKPLPIIDIALAKDGVIRGRVLKVDGTPIDGARVHLKQKEKIVAALVADKEGRFAVKGLKSGLYQIDAPTGSGLYRFWTKETAPPSAKPQALLVAKAPVVRGQYGYLMPQELIGLGLGVAGVTLGAIAVTKLDSVEDRTTRIERSVKRALASP